MMPLTKEQFIKARKAGFSVDQIATFEKRRQSEFGKQTVQPSAVTPTKATVPEQPRTSRGVGGEWVEYPKRQGLPFMSPIPTSQQREQLNIKGVAKGVAGRGLGNLAALLQREESVFAETYKNWEQLPPGQKYSAALLGPLGIMGAGAIAGREDIAKSIRGESALEIGDLFRSEGVPEPAAATMGLIVSGGLPSGFAGSALLKKLGILKGMKPKPSMIAKATAQLLGVEQEALEQTAKLGYRQVLQKKYFNKKLPAILQEKLIKSLDEIRTAASKFYDEAIEPLKNTQFETGKFFKKMSKVFTKTRKSPFKGAVKDFNQNILDGFVTESKAGRMKSYGDLLDLRRFLDEQLAYADRQGINKKFALETRKLVNEQLHTNEVLRKADGMWTDLIEQIDSIGKKVSNDTGETILKNFQSKPVKTQKRLLEMQDMIMRQKASAGLPPGEDIMREVVKSSLAREFVAKMGRTSIHPASLKERALLPVFRGGLRTGELVAPVGAAVRVGARQAAVPTTRRGGQLLQSLIQKNQNQ